MKNTIAILGLLLFPFIASANFSLDDGKYYNRSLDKRVKINCTNNSIHIKNLVSYDWRKFKRRGHRLFEDRHGNRIRVIGPNTFEFNSRRTHRVLVFQRVSFGDRVACSISCGPGCGACGGDFRPAPPVYDDYRDYGSSQGRPNRPYSSNSGLEGVWSNSRYNSDVIIERTNEGLRAKIIGSNREWTYYRQDSYDKKEYYDNRGNRYVVRSPGELVWYPKEGGSAITMRKLR